MGVTVSADFMVDTLKLNARSSTHEELDGILAAFMRNRFGKAKLKTELLRVAGKTSCRCAILAMRPVLKCVFRGTLDDKRIAKHKPLTKPPAKPPARRGGRLVTVHV